MNIFKMNVFRFLHTTANMSSVNKSALAALRKKTGFAFSNCRKALELHENDLPKAEKWLRDQAQALGWEKVNKLSGRTTSQGLIGLSISSNKAAMVEVNCESDFVARTSQFRSLVDVITSACLKSGIQENENEISKVELSVEDINNFKFEDKTLSDHVALVVGSIGENILIKRATTFTTSGNIKLAGLTHPPSPKMKDTLCGKFGALVVYNEKPGIGEIYKEERAVIGQNLCQHIIGMNPLKIGSENEDKPDEVVENEKALIYQEYLLEEEVAVGQYLEEVGVNVLDFKRFECGEDTQSEEIPEVEKVNVSAEA